MKYKKEKMSTYFKHTRLEMQKYIPKGLSYYLDVGCGEGNFGTEIKKLTQSKVWGVEPNEEAFKKAKQKLDFVHAGFFDEKIKDYSQVFDCIIFNDVLEHMYEPEKAIKLSKEILSENGIIVCSIPNFLFWPNIKKLLTTRDWQYEDAGILDKTHVHFFTRNSIIRFFKECQIEIITIEGINPYKSRLFKLINKLSFNKLSDFMYTQYACVLKVKTIIT